MPPSGPWTGFFVQSRTRGTMSVRLLFSDGAVSGSGADRDGPFVFDGAIRGDRVAMWKRYPWLEVRYEGFWDGAMIAGRWSFEHFDGLTLWGDEGEFELWPEGTETHLGDRSESLVASA